MMMEDDEQSHAAASSAASCDAMQATEGSVEEAHDSLSPAKPRKHSGPRKRRPKKKNKAAAEVQQPHELAADDGDDEAHDASPRAARMQLRADANAFVPSVLVSSPPPRLHASPRLALSLSPLTLATPGAGDPEDRYDRAYWTQYVIEAAEAERARRLRVLRQLQEEEAAEIQRRRAWAIAAIEQEQQAMMREMFLDNMKNTQWFQSTISRFAEDYEVVCPNSWFGCTFSCMLQDLEAHVETCSFRQVPERLDQVVAGDDAVAMDLDSYDVVCPNAMLGCSAICAREHLAEHLSSCPVNGMTREKEWAERQEWQQNVILLTEEERARRMQEDADAHRRQPSAFVSFTRLQRLYEEQTAAMHGVLHDEIQQFARQCQQHATRRRPAVERAIAALARELQELWGPDTRVETYGSFATQLHGGHSDVDLVIYGATHATRSSQQCVQQLADHLRALVPSSSSSCCAFREIGAIARAAIPLVKVVVESPLDDGTRLELPFDITFDDANGCDHNGVASAALLETLLARFYGLRELTLVLKQFLVKRGLNDPYVGGLSSYGLVLMILFVLQEQGAVLSTEEEEEEETLEDQAKELPPYEVKRRWGRRVALAIVRQVRTRVRGFQRSSQDAGTRRNVAPAWEILHYGSPPLSAPGGQPPQPQQLRPPFLLGKLLMDVLQFYGNDFRQHHDQIVVLDGDSSGDPQSAALSAPRSVSPTRAATTEAFVVIQDPLAKGNNVGRTCYRISQVLREFSDFVSVLTALIVRGRVTTAATGDMSCRILHSVFEMTTTTAAAAATTTTATATTPSAMRSPVI
ncbi:hypothetical protein P43SY_001697 [Pythium insidiosum]|uniref:Poly(A) RNA polymerase mitochondrial-like central palm domain-containing protein n=1 Tax=Pythium insidiosum TaxID=114742 RepID=A0AAD5M317_PYTIN|nr:hypothetical protein P43SY_001697 [Pythium insidiosum]